MKHRLFGLLLPLLLLSSKGLSGKPAGEPFFHDKTMLRLTSPPAACDPQEIWQQRPSPLRQLFREKQRNSKKIIAATLAFPLPFGIVGLHRIYLGSAPYVPVAYIASLGGMFGVLPFIDFCVLLAAKKTDPFINNKKIFMWVE